MQLWTTQVASARGAARTAQEAEAAGWDGLLVSGIITLLLGLMIWNEWPLSGVWVIGLFVGIDMFFYGGWFVSLALAVRTLGRAQDTDRSAEIAK